MGGIRKAKDNRVGTKFSKNNNMNSKKRYIVTYHDGSISAEDASQILGVAKSKCKEGVAFLETNETPKESDILHFENLGVSTLELDEKQVDNLAKNPNVMAVEEDQEMFAFKNELEEDEQYKDLFLLEADQDVLENDEFASLGDYKEGYKQAFLDIISSFFDAKTLVPKQKETTDGQFTRRIFQNIPWNINLVKAPNAWRKGITGKGVNLAILDTGITKHPDLKISGGVSFIPGSTSYDDLHGHGTHCAGIAAAKNNKIGVVGVAPDVKLFAVKVLGNDGRGMTSWIIAGMEWCVRNKMKVASMSLGGLSGPQVSYATAVKRCQANGVTVVVASGNSYGSRFPWVCAPANSFINNDLLASPISVGAINRNCVIAPFSSRGGQTPAWNQVTCVAPGVAINSTYLKNGYKTMGGTSMACPHVAGLAALIIQRYPTISPLNVKRRIASTCIDLGPGGYDITYGSGLINCDRAV